MTQGGVGKMKFKRRRDVDAIAWQNKREKHRKMHEEQVAALKRKKESPAEGDSLNVLKEAQEQ
jgi:hypothetical protein